MHIFLTIWQICWLRTVCEVFNWTSGTQPVSPKSRLLLGLSETVNKPLTWHSQIEAGEPDFSWHNMRYSLHWINMKTNAFLCMVILWVAMVTRDPIFTLITLALINCFPGVMNCEAVYYGVRYDDVYICLFHFTVREFHHIQVATLQLSNNNVTARDVTGSV